jgi:hypothetical protein
MKIVTANSGKKTLKISKSEWKAIGEKQGWLEKEARYISPSLEIKLVRLLAEEASQEEGDLVAVVRELSKQVALAVTSFDVQNRAALASFKIRKEIKPEPAVPTDRQYHSPHDWGGDA